MEVSWLSNPLTRIRSKLNSVFFKIMAAMIIVSLMIFIFVPLILTELREATTGIVIDALSQEQEYLFNEILVNTKESVFISAKPFVLKQEIISTREQIEEWERLLLGIGNSLNRQYGLIRLMTFDLSGRMIHDYGIDDNMPRFDPQQQSIQKITTHCLETESSTEGVVASLKNSPYWGLCLLSEDRDEEVSNAHLFILDYKKILTKMKETTEMDIAIQIGNSIIHDNLGKKFIDGVIKNENTLLAPDSEGKVQHYIIAKSALINRHILPKDRELKKLIFFINSEKIHASLQAITSNLTYTMLLIAVLSSLFLLAAIHYLLRPIKGVTKIAQAVSNGDYSVRLNHKSGDEIGTVMNTIDNMLDKIQQNYKAIKREKENAETAEKTVSELRRQNELILNSAGEGIYGLDINGNTTFVNPSASRMIGWKPDEIIGKSEHNTIHHTRPDGTPYPQEECQIFAAFKDGSANKVDNEVFWRKDGSSFPVEYLSTPIRDENDRVVGAVVTFRDITERKNAENALKKSQSTIIQQAKMASIGQLAGGIAHDFNNILSVIIGYSELALKDMHDDSPVKEHISTVYSAGKKAVSLTSELLAFSRKQPLAMKPSNINDILDNMKNILTRLIGDNINLTLIKHRDLKNVLADKTQIEQVVMNLIVNARDAMLHGGDLIIKTLNVHFRKGFDMGNEHIEPGPYTMLSVRDTGEGMTEEVQKSIFEPFFSTKEISKGTGMGLATVYGVVKQHGGYITMHSKTGVGTVFKVYVPTTDRDIEEDVSIHTHVVTGSETVLVVDDEPLLSGLVSEILEPLGYRVLVASNGKEALKVSNNFSGRIDLLLTDVIMPGMNGRELAEEFIVKRPETKVIYMSGYTDDIVAHHGVLEDSVVLINKPIKSNVITSKIREVLDTKPNHSHNQTAVNKLNNINILLVDDDEDIRNLLKVYLKDYKCNIDTAENGKIAVDKFKSGTYDLVLMDMQMPVMDGITATKAIRQWEDERGVKQTKIIALTGNAAQEEIDTCLNSGCSSHIAKPIKKDKLVKELSLHMPEKEKETCNKKELPEERFIAQVDKDLEDLIPEYLQQRQNDIKRIQEAMKAQDYEAARMLGHSLKGSGSGYGFEPITEIGLRIEDAAKEKNCEDIEKYIIQLSYYIENVEIICE